MFRWVRLFPLLFTLSCGNCALVPPSPPAAVSQKADAGEPKKPRPPLQCLPGRHCVVEFDFQGEVDEDDVQVAKDFLEDAAKLRPEFLVFRIDSHGGNVDQGLHLARALEEAPFPVICLVDNEALSMGFFILQSCDTRLMTPRAKLMAHEARFEKLENVTAADLQGRISELRVSDIQLVEQACRRLRVKPDEYRDLVHGRDWYMAAGDALRVGAVDQVWGHDAKTLVRRLSEFGSY